MAARAAVILGVMAGAFALEVVLPLVRAALRKRREAQEREGAQASPASAGLAKADSDATPPSAVSAPCAPAVRSVFAKVDDTEGGDEAQRLWEEARAMPHQEVADFATDWQYMALLHNAAMLGHAEACSKVGDYAYRRGELVGAFFWKLRVEMCGGRCRNPSLADVVRKWTEVGCPDGSEDVGACLSERQADFARAVLCLKSRVDPRYGTMRLKELADDGDEDAKRFLKRRSP